MNAEEQKKICVNFGIPDVASGMLDFFFDDEELQFILDHGNDTFGAKDVGEDFINRKYRNGLISKTDESGEHYRLNNFYYFLDVFAVGRKEKYDELSKETKREIDNWYFDAYYDALDKSKPQATTDRVVPMDEIIKEIEADDRPIYLNDCDCRSLTGECGMPTRTCLTYRNGINTFVDRGMSEKIDKERAIEVIREADKAGLMHTIAMGGICNCCGDCCYLFKGQKRMDSTGVWPYSKYIAHLDKDACVNCKRCIRRCQLEAFDLQDGAVELHSEKCAGCGLCVNTCPTGALTLKLREN